MAERMDEADARIFPAAPAEDRAMSKPELRDCARRAPVISSQNEVAY
jgi:hypothetical protein